MFEYRANDEGANEVTDFLFLNPFVTADDASILFTAKFGVLISTSDIFTIEDLVTIWAWKVDKIDANSRTYQLMLHNTLIILSIVPMLVFMANLYAVIALGL